MKFILKWLVPMLVIMLLFTAVIPLTVSAANNISVFVDGTEMVFDVPPAVVNERTMVPVRAIFERLGAKVEWIPEENGIRATTDTLDIYMQLGKPQITVNGTVTELDVAPYATNNRTLVPLRAVAEAFSASVNWVQETSSVVIFSPDERYQKELDKTANDVFDPRHIRTSQNGVEYVDLWLTGESKLRVLFKTNDPTTKAFAVRFDQGKLTGVTDVTPDKRCSVILDLNDYGLSSARSADGETCTNTQTPFPCRTTFTAALPAESPSSKAAKSLHLPAQTVQTQASILIWVFIFRVVL